MGDFRYFFFKLFLKKASRIQAWCDFTYFPGGSSQEHFLPTEIDMKELS